MIVGTLIGVLRIKGHLNEDEIASIGGAMEPVLTEIGPGASAVWAAVLTAQAVIRGDPQDE